MHLFLLLILFCVPVFSEEISPTVPDMTLDDMQAEMDEMRSIMGDLKSIIEDLNQQIFLIQTELENANTTSADVDKKN